MLKNSLQYAKWLLPLGLAAGFIMHTQHIFKNWDEMHKRHRVWRLNRLNPNFSFLASYTIGDTPQDKEVYLNEAILFYKTVIKYYPRYADGFTMLGFCLHKAGQLKEAEEAYLKSLKMQPGNFWAHHNLSTLLFQQKKYAKAIEAAREALEVDPAKTRYIISQSFIFRQIQTKIPRNYNFTEKIRIGQSNCFGILVLSHYILGEKNQAFDMAELAYKKSVEPKNLFQLLQFMVIKSVMEKETRTQPFQTLMDQFNQRLDIEIF